MGALALAAAAATVGAQGLDGTGKFLCAATSSVVCERSGKCLSALPETLNLPVFWHVDPVAKTVQSKRPDGVVRSSQIAAVALSGEMLVMQGSDDGFGWSVSIERASGGMVLTGSRDLAFVVFGNCTAP